MGRNGRLFVSNTTVAVPRGFVTMCHQTGGTDSWQVNEGGGIATES
jgi:hypothetical protein